MNHPEARILYFVIRKFNGISSISSKSDLLNTNMGHFLRYLNFYQGIKNLIWKKKQHANTNCWFISKWNK